MTPETLTDSVGCISLLRNNFFVYLRFWAGPMSDWGNVVPVPLPTKDADPEISHNHLLKITRISQNMVHIVYC